MIHRFVDLLREVVRLPDIPILVRDQSPLSTHTIWKIGNAATPERMSTTAVSVTSSVHLGDPEREPVTGDYVVYSRFNVTGTINRSVRLVDWDNTTDIQLYADASGGVAGSLQPRWKPDGSKILFRAKGAGGALNLIKHMDPDGTNVATVYTGVGTVENPSYSHDGTKIAWNEIGGLKVANADGTSVANLVAAASGVFIDHAWKRNALTIAYLQTVGTNEVWKVINSDGTGGATWLTISRAGYGPGQGNAYPIMYSWRLDDSYIATTVRQPADPDPDARLTQIDSGGSNLISPAVYAAADTGSSDRRPVVIAGMAEGVERIFLSVQNPSSSVIDHVVSVLPDGSDLRTDWDGTYTAGGSAYQGFRGDTLNV